MEQKLQATSNNKLREVIQYYSDEIKKNPSDSTNLVLRSACYESLHKYAEALKDALQVIGNDPSYWKGHHQAMKMHLMMDNVKEADKTPVKYKQSEVFKKLYDELNILKMEKENQTRSQLANPIKIENNSYESSRVTKNQQEFTNKPSTSFTNTSDHRMEAFSAPNNRSQLGATNSKPTQTTIKIPTEHRTRMRRPERPLEVAESPIRLTDETVRSRSFCCCG